MNKVKYKLLTGHKGDQFFILSDGLIIEIYYNKARAEEALRYWRKVN